MSAAGAASVFSDWRNGRALRRDCGCRCREAATTPAPCGWVGPPNEAACLVPFRLRTACSWEPSQPRCAPCALTGLGLGARAKGTVSSSPSCPAPPRSRRERRARTGGSSHHDRPAGAGGVGARPGPRRGRLTGHEGRGSRHHDARTGCGLTSDSAVEPPSRQRHDVGGAARAAPAHRPDTLEAKRTGWLGWVRRSRLARRLRRA